MPSGNHSQAATILDAMQADASLIAPEIAGWWSAYLTNHRGRYLDVLTLLEQQQLLAGEVLDVGSVPGHLVVLLHELGVPVQGVDLAPQRVQAFWDKYHVTVTPVDIEREPLPFPADSFRAILFSEVLEHLRWNPLFTLRELHRVLAPGGKLLLAVPNITPIDRWGFLRGRDYQGDPVTEFQKLETVGHMGHIRLYSQGEVSRFLKHTGFTPLYWARRGKKRAGSHPVGRLVWLLMNRIPYWSDAYRSHLYVVAQK